MAPGSSWTRASFSKPFFWNFTRSLLGWSLWIPPAIWFNNNVGELTWINGPSMHPYLNEDYNQTLRKYVCWQQKMYARDNLQHGMIITFWYVLLSRSLL
jgi:mitochondrial inner membrane protease subunit 2